MVGALLGGYVQKGFMVGRGCGGKGGYLGGGGSVWLGEVVHESEGVAVERVAAMSAGLLWRGGLMGAVVGQGL